MFTHDLRFAARTLVRRPAFTAIVVLTLSLCIGASTAVFSIVESVLLRGLAYRDLDRLVAVWSNNPKEKNDHYQVSIGDYFDWRARNHSFEQLAGFFPDLERDVHRAECRRAHRRRRRVGEFSSHARRSSAHRPRLRSTPRRVAQRSRSPSSPTQFWARAFGQDASVLGKTIALDGTAVRRRRRDGCRLLLSAESRRRDRAAADPRQLHRPARSAHAVGDRTSAMPGVTIARARQEMDAIAAQLRQEHPQEDAGLGVTLNALADDLLGDVRRPIVVLFAAVCAVLLIGCANVANLMLVRATGRQQELSVRAAMGAQPGAIARQLLTESGADRGGVGRTRHCDRVRDDARDLGDAAGVDRAHRHRARRRHRAGVHARRRVCSSRCSAASGRRCAALASVGRQQPERRCARKLARSARRDGSTVGLVVGEIALALVLVVSAGLLINSFARLAGDRCRLPRRSSGSNEDGVAGRRVFARTKRDQFFETLIAQTRALPGVSSVGTITRFPLHDGNLTTNGHRRGRAARRPTTSIRRPTTARRVRATSRRWEFRSSPGATSATADLADTSSQTVAIVNRTAAMTFFNTPNPVGRRVRLGGPNGRR